MEDQTRWVQMLIQTEMPKGTDELTMQRYLSYFMRILSARLGNGIDEKSVRQQIVQQGKTTQQQLKLQELLLRLDKYPAAISRKPAILHLLSKLSNSSADFECVEAIFKNAKECIASASGLHQHSSMMHQQQNVTMEIENNTTMHTTMQHNNSTQQSLQNVSALNSTYRNNSNNNNTGLSQSTNPHFLQTVKRVHNKGNPSIDLTERDLIRDLLFAFQAIQGHYIAFNPAEERLMLKANLPVSDPVRMLVDNLCQMGDYYRKVEIALQVEPQGQIKQALHQAIRDELNEYYRLIAIFENKLNEETASFVSNAVATASQNMSLLSASNSGNVSNAAAVSAASSNPDSFTLRKLQLWVIEPQERLKWLAIICDATKGMSGFQVISAVNAYETQGSPPIQQLISRILQRIMQPFMKYVNSWVYNGELQDPLSEFFVTENLSQVDFWNKRYELVVSQIPNIIDRNNALRIFNIGRSVNFLHRACKSNDWKLALAPCDLKIIDRKSFDVFKQWVEEAAIQTNNRIVAILVDKFQLKQHLFAIKKYILMGQGDFIQQLMDLLTDQLSKNANEIHRHNLLGMLENAIRITSTSTNSNTETSNRLDIKLLEPSPGEKGWDIFSLNYIVDAPIDTILSPPMMQSYLRIFNFLWRVRRVSHCLSQVWLDHQKQSKLLRRDKALDPICRVMKRFTVLRHQMTHFIDNLTCYIMVDAIETSWKSFLDSLDRTTDFSEIIEIHQNFVRTMLDKALLTEKNQNIYRQIISLFNLIIKFRTTQLVILSEIAEEYERIREVRNSNAQKRVLGDFHSGKKNQHDDSNDGGAYDDDDDDNKLESEDFRMPPTARLFSQHTADFEKQFSDLLVLLKKEDKLRFLSFKLDFNEFYSAKQTDSLASFTNQELNKYSASGNLNILQQQYAPFKPQNAMPMMNRPPQPQSHQASIANTEYSSQSSGFFFKPSDMPPQRHQQQQQEMRDSFFSQAPSAISAGDNLFTIPTSSAAGGQFSRNIFNTSHPTLPQSSSQLSLNQDMSKLSNNPKFGGLTPPNTGGFLAKQQQQQQQMQQQFDQPPRNQGNNHIFMDNGMNFQNNRNLNTEFGIPKFNNTDQSISSYKKGNALNGNFFQPKGQGMMTTTSVKQKEESRDMEPEEGYKYDNHHRKADIFNIPRQNQQQQQQYSHNEFEDSRDDGHDEQNDD